MKTRVCLVPPCQGNDVDVDPGVDKMCGLDNDCHPKLEGRVASGGTVTDLAFRIASDQKVTSSGKKMTLGTALKACGGEDCHGIACRGSDECYLARGSSQVMNSVPSWTSYVRQGGK